MPAPARATTTTAQATASTTRRGSTPLLIHLNVITFCSSLSWPWSLTHRTAVRSKNAPSPCACRGRRRFWSFFGEARRRVAGMSELQLRQPDALGTRGERSYVEADVEIRVLGPLGVTSAGADVHLGGRKQRTVLEWPDRKSTRLNSSHSQISYAVFCLKKKTTDLHSPISSTT